MNLSDEEFLIKVANALENCQRVSDSDLEYRITDYDQYLKSKGNHILLSHDFAIDLAKRLRDISEKV